jgi:hypothetical protein
MHAPIDQLLSLRDGEPVDAAAASHVEGCAHCRGTLARLERTTRALRELPALDAPAGSWQRVREAMDRPAPGLNQRRLFAVAAGIVAVLSLSIAFLTSREDEKVVEQETSPELPVVIEVEPAQLNALVARSQQLEGLLQGLPERPRIERVSTVATIDALEQRIQWLDIQLSSAPDVVLSAEQTQQLWTERVTLMDSLVKVRYAEAGRMSF